MDIFGVDPALWWAKFTEGDISAATPRTGEAALTETDYSGLAQNPIARPFVAAGNAISKGFDNATGIFSGFFSKTVVLLIVIVMAFIFVGVFALRFSKKVGV
jgi:hypothetical protein